MIYFGSWGNDNSPRASTYTSPEIFDARDPEQLIEFSKRLDLWESQPDEAKCDDEFDDSEAHLIDNRQEYTEGAEDFGLPADEHQELIAELRELGVSVDEIIPPIRSVELFVFSMTNL